LIGFLVLLTAAVPGKGPAVSGFDRIEALEYLDTLAGVLEDFRDLTSTVIEAAGASSWEGLGAGGSVDVDRRTLAGIGNTDWEMQNLGFPNLVRYLRGTIEAQQLEILTLRLRVAELEGAPETRLDSIGDLISNQAGVLEMLSATGWAD
jgi:hypothetical protein